eukprot:c8568_g1_i2 orf=93-299(-)
MVSRICHDVSVVSLFDARHMRFKIVIPLMVKALNFQLAIVIPVLACTAHQNFMAEPLCTIVEVIILHL